MKMRTFFLIILFTLGSSLISCFYDDTCDPVQPHFKILGIELTNMRYTGRSDEFPWKVMNETVPIEWENHFIRIGFEVEYIANHQAATGSSLMALSCVPAGYRGDKVGVDSISVTTLFDINENYPAGSIINEITEINIRTSEPEDFEEFVPISSYIDENEEGVLFNGFELKINEAPFDDVRFAVEVIYTLNNGEKFTARSSEIMMKI